MHSAVFGSRRLFAPPTINTTPQATICAEDVFSFVSVGSLSTPDWRRTTFSFCDYLVHVPCVCSGVQLSQRLKIALGNLSAFWRQLVMSLKPRRSFSSCRKSVLALFLSDDQVPHFKDVVPPMSMFARLTHLPFAADTLESNNALQAAAPNG